MGYEDGHPSSQTVMFGFQEQNRELYYKSTHVQAIKFQISRLILDELMAGHGNGSSSKQKVLRLQSRHQLFPQVYRYVDDYATRKVDFQGCDPCELGLEKYVQRIVARLRDQIMPDDEEGEPPLMLILNRYKPIGSTADV